MRIAIGLLLVASLLGGSPSTAQDFGASEWTQGAEIGATTGNHANADGSFLVDKMCDIYRFNGERFLIATNCLKELPSVDVVFRIFNGEEWVDDELVKFEVVQTNTSHGYSLITLDKPELLAGLQQLTFKRNLSSGELVAIDGTPCLVALASTPNILCAYEAESDKLIFAEDGTAVGLASQRPIAEHVPRLVAGLISDEGDDYPRGEGCATSSPVTFKPDADGVEQAGYISVTYDFSSVLATCSARFLVVATPNSVRVEGSGFLVLPPNVTAGEPVADWKVEQTRILIPTVRGAAGLLFPGDLRIHVLGSESASLAWGVFDSKFEFGETSEVAVRPPPSRIIERDAADGAFPRTVTSSPRGDTLLLTSESSFRVVRASDGLLIASGPGTNPAYSRTGRFLTTIRGSQSLVDLYDLDAGELVGTIGDLSNHSEGNFVSYIVWAPEDALLGISSRGDSTFDIVQPLADRSPTVIGGPHLSMPWDLGFTIDLASTSVRYLDLCTTLLFGVGPSSDLISEKLECESQVDEGWDLLGTPATTYSEDVSAGYEDNVLADLTAGQERIFRYAPMLDVAVSDNFKLIPGYDEAAAKDVIGVGGINADHIDKEALFARDNITVTPAVPWMTFDNGGGEAFTVALARQLEDDLQAPSGRRNKEIFYEDLCWDELPDAINTIDAEMVDHGVRSDYAGVIYWLVHYSCDIGNGIPTRMDHYKLLTIDGNSTTYAVLDCCNDVGYRAFPISPTDVLLVGSDGDIHRLDVSTGKITWHARDPLLSADGIAAFENTAGGDIVGISTSGHVSIMARATGERLLGGTIIANELILYTASGYYFSNDDGERYLGIRVGADPGIYPLSRFRTTLKRPDIVEAALRGKVFQSPVLHTPPMLRVDSVAVEDSVAYLAGTLTYHGSAAELQVAVNGQVKSRMSNNGSGTWRFDSRVDVPGGPSVLTVRGSDDQGYVSSDWSQAIGDPTRKLPGGLAIISVGTSTYGAGVERIPNGAKDAEDFVAMSSNWSKGYSDGLVMPAALIADQHGAGETLQRAMDAYAAAAGPDDTLLVFVSGHGVRTDKGLLLLTNDSYLDAAGELQGTSISWDKLSDQLTRLPGHVVVFLDACHSGGADSSNESLVDDLTDTVTPILVLASSKGSQQSEDSAELQNGYFTAALKHVSQDAKPGHMTAVAYFTKVRQLVEATTNGGQTPWLNARGFLGDFVLF